MAISTRLCRRSKVTSLFTPHVRRRFHSRRRGKVPPQGRSRTSRPTSWVPCSASPTSRSSKTNSASLSSTRHFKVEGLPKCPSQTQCAARSSQPDYAADLNGNIDGLTREEFEHKTRFFIETEIVPAMDDLRMTMNDPARP